MNGKMNPGKAFGLGLGDCWEASPEHAYPLLWDCKTEDVEMHSRLLADDPDPATATRNGQNDALFSLLAAAAAWSIMRFGKRLMVTSIYRTENDPNGLHRLWRAADIRVARTVHEEAQTLTTEEATALCQWINRTFLYGTSSSGRITNVAHFREGGTMSEPVAHVHLQVPDHEGTWQ